MWFLLLLSTFFSLFPPGFLVRMYFPYSGSSCSAPLFPKEKAMGSTTNDDQDQPRRCYQRSEAHRGAVTLSQGMERYRAWCIRTVGTMVFKFPCYFFDSLKKVCCLPHTGLRALLYFLPSIFPQTLSSLSTLSLCFGNCLVSLFVGGFARRLCGQLRRLFFVLLLLLVFVLVVIKCVFRSLPPIHTINCYIRLVVLN